MKREIGVEKPSYLKEAWPGKYQLFSWLDYVVNIPYPVFIITTLKENGKPNTCLHSWGCFGGDEGGYYAILTMLKSYHTYENILRSGEWGIGFSSADYHKQCMKTIECNGPENDEITEAGFTVEPASVVGAPRIAECLISLECKLEWERPLFEGSRWHVFAGRVVHLAVDDQAFELDPGKRLEKLDTMYNVRSTLNPLTGEARLLLKESLKDEGILDMVRVTKTEVWDIENAEDWQLRQWTAISFEGESDRADEVAEAMSRVMKPEWYANFSTETHVYVIFQDKFFKYVKGDVQARAEVEAYAISVGIPESQVDWGGS